MNKTLLATLCLLCGPAAFADAVDDVRCREIAFSLSAEEQDIAAFASFIDPDARFVSNSVLHGPDEVAAAWQVFFEADGPSIAWRPQIVEVLEDGTLALSRGPYKVVSANVDGDVVESWGTYNSIWRLDADGNWHIIFDAGSPAAAPPDEATQALLEADDDC